MGRVCSRSHGSGSGGSPPQAAVFGVIETAARRLNVGLRLGEVPGSAVVDQRIEARQAGAGGEKNRQEQHGS